MEGDETLAKRKARENKLPTFNNIPICCQQLCCCADIETAFVRDMWSKYLECGTQVDVYAITKRISFQMLQLSSFSLFQFCHKWRENMSVGTQGHLVLNQLSIVPGGKEDLLKFSWEKTKTTLVGEVRITFNFQVKNCYKVLQPVMQQVRRWWMQSLLNNKIAPTNSSYNILFQDYLLLRGQKKTHSYGVRTKLKGLISDNKYIPIISSFRS